MKQLTKSIGIYPLGIWITLIALGFTLIAWLMQAYSLLDWEGAIALGIQGESFRGGAVERALANVEWGIALADILWVLPITIIALIGILKNKLYGYTAAMMDFAICVYFPLFFTIQRWDTDFETAIGAIILFAIPSILGIISLWHNRFRYFKS